MNTDLKKEPVPSRLFEAIIGTLVVLAMAGGFVAWATYESRVRDRHRSPRYEKLLEKLDDTREPNHASGPAP
jgi:predicted negative regulator of RcsB-dependent stress response